MQDKAHIFDETQSVFVGRARSGICALIDVLGLKNHQILIPSNICPTVVVAILAAQALPVLCDTDLKDGLADDDLMAQTLLSGGSKGMVMPSHLCGMVKSYPKTLAAARLKGWFILENDSQGSYFRTRHCFGDALLISYGAGKVVDAGGGGELICSDPKLLEALKARLADYPLLSKAHLQRETAHMLERRALRSLPAEAATARYMQVTEAEAQDIGTRPSQELLKSIRGARSQAIGTFNARTETLHLWQEALKNIDRLQWPHAKLIAPWRLIARLPGQNRDRVVTALRAQGFDAGTNYPSVAHAFTWIFETVPPNSEIWGQEVINLWLDSQYDRYKIARGAQIIRETLYGH